MSDLATRVQELVRPLAEVAGVEVLEVQVKGSGPRQLVRVVIDRDGGVDLVTCQSVSELVSARLDQADPIADRYALEVTSPGVDRPLEDRRAFERVHGRTVLVQQSAGDDRVIQVRGVVQRADEETVTLAVDDEPVVIRYRDIVKATQALPW